MLTATKENGTASAKEERKVNEERIQIIKTGRND